MHGKSTALSHKETSYVTSRGWSLLFFWFALFSRRRNDQMKRIALLVCGMLLLIANSAEARRAKWTNGGSYSQPAQVAPAATSVAAVSSAPSSTSAQVTQVSYSTSTAQGVANLMAANNRVGHWGGNPGYEGCGCGATQAAAYNICCYANSGMTTVDVGYAQASNGIWYCCRRYR